jgi:23S rRNA G2069 N7-methylase RlmK/C1962 C5-methylase RlmI
MVEQDKATGKKTKSKEYKHYSEEDSPTIPTQLIGWGVYNPSSLYRVRILCHSNLQTSLAKALKKEDVDAMETILRQRFASAIATRRALNLPSEQTDTFRLVNGEGDGISGLAIDILPIYNYYNFAGVAT